MHDKYDLIVIGAGPGGYVAAIRAAQLGLKTAIIEKEYMGGVCLNWGCIPSKTLLYATELKRTLEEAKRIGLNADNISIDLEKLRKHKDDTVKRLTGGVQLLLEKAGVDIIFGKATLFSPNEIGVITSAGEKEYNADKIIIATGASSVELPMLKFDGKYVIGARESIDLPSVPEEMLIVGAGPIGVEMATVYQTLGAKVTIVEMFDSVLPMLDKDLSSAAQRAFKKQGMNLMLSSKVVSSKVNKDKVEVVIESKSGNVEKSFDMVLVVAGMKPNTDKLNLASVGVEVDDKGFIKVDSRMKTACDNIYAIGDVAGGILLAHKASHEGIVAAENAAGKTALADWKGVPYAVFTDPEIAGIGLTEKEVSESGKKYKVGKFPYRALGKAIATLASDGFVKIITDEETDEILGIHMFGPHSGDNIFAGTALMEMDGTAEDLSHMMAIHPTLSEGLMEAALSVHKKAIHIVN